MYGDGYLNTTGTYNGVNDFNQGLDAEATVKAGYDSKYIYILIEWKDTTADASYLTWLWEGPEDPLKNDSTEGWTSQRNNDNVTLLFEISGSAQNAWHWSLAYTAPFDQALSLEANQNDELLTEQNGLPFNRNAESDNGRVGPLYEWNGERQEIILSNGDIKILDPAYYLSDKHKMTFTGDVVVGENVFNEKADCKFCHGINGNGIPEGYTNGGALNGTFTNKYTREGLIEYIGSRAHEGSGNQYWGRIENNPEDVENMLAFMRGIAGIPGHTVTYSEDITDIKAISNIVVGGIEIKNTVYQVLFKKPLSAEKSYEVNFDPLFTYKLKIHFSDNDEINLIGSNTIELIFKSSEL